MYRLVLVMMITAVAWSSVGCGGPGAPVNKAADLRNRSGGGTTDESANAGRGNRGPGNQDQNKGDEDASEDDAKSEDSSDGDETKEPGDGDENAKEPEKEAEKKPASVAESKARLRPGRPPGLSIATGGGRRGDNKNEDELETSDAKERPPAEIKDDSPAAGIENESPVEKHRFTFFERANYAFSTENETEAFQYLYAHAIAEDNALNEHPIAWYVGIAEPRLGLRWGVGVFYNPGSFDGDPPKFGGDGDSSSGGGSNNSGVIGGWDIGNRLPGGGQRRPGNSGSSAGVPPAGEDPTEQLLYYTGDFGELLLQRIELRRTNPDFYWGKALYEIDATKTFEEKTSTVGGRSARDRSNRDRGERGVGGNMQSTEDGDAQPDNSSSSNSGDDNGNRRNPPLEIPGFEPEFQADPTSLVPGAIMLGLGNRKEILERAQLHGLDLVAVFDVKISGADNRNTTVLTILDVKTGEEVAESRRLTTAAYSNALDTGKENPIELELDKLFPEATDIKYKCSEFPGISSESASNRVQQLLEQKTDNPLPLLVEAKHYLEEGLITKDEYIAAAEALIGAGNARKLVDGNIDEREEALHDWLPGQYSVNIGNTDGFR